MERTAQNIKRNKFEIKKADFEVEKKAQECVSYFKQY
jgi:hypothetical protein